MALELFCFVAIIFGVREQWKEDVGGGGGGRGDGSETLSTPLELVGRRGSSLIELAQPVIKLLMPVGKFICLIYKMIRGLSFCFVAFPLPRSSSPSPFIFFFKL